MILPVIFIFKIIEFQELLTKKFENYFELAELDGTDLITSLDHFECSVCLEYYFPGYGVILKDCLHTFCRYVRVLKIIKLTDFLSSFSFYDY